MSATANPLPGLRIHRVRDEAVLLDSDLAALYGVETKVFNRAVKRHARRFPADFAFQLTAAEFTALSFQIGTSTAAVAAVTSRGSSPNTARSWRRRSSTANAPSR